MADSSPRDGKALWTIIAALALLVATVVSLLQGVPKLWAPWPVPMVLLTILAGPLAFIAPAGAFLLWSKQLFRGEPRVPHRSLGALVILASLSIWYFASVWSEGILRYGFGYVGVAAATNATLVVVLSGLAIWTYRRPSFAFSMTFHFLLFFWQACYAFPYFGEGL
jgi:hypothetical protein